MKIFVRLLLLWIALCSRFVYAGNGILTTDKSDPGVREYFPVLNESNTTHSAVPISADWIKDYSEPRIISESNYAKLSKLLRSFNKRKDGLRVYVLIAPDLKASVPSDILKSADLLSLKKVINNLSSEKPTDWEKLERDWDQFLFKEPNKIIESIDNSLARQGHTQRIVLYFRITHFHNPSTDKMESRIFCKINMAGDKLEQHKGEILVKAREGVDLNAKFQNRQRGIITTITNVIDAIKTEYDRKKPAESICTAGPLSTVVAGSQAHKDAIQDFVDLLNKPTHFKSEYFIVDAPRIMEGEIAETSPYSDVKAGCTIPSKEFTTDILPDKLNLLAQNSDYRVYVVLHRVDFMLDNDQRGEFAKQVFDASNLKGNSKNILVVVPYYYCFTTRPPEYDGSTRVSPGSMSGPLMFMPAACSGDAAVVKDFNAYFSDFPNWQQAFNKGFVGIPKNYIVYDYKMIWNGDVIYDGIERYDKVKGFEDIVAVRIVEDSRFDALAEGICIDPRVSDPVRNRRYRDCLKNDYGPKFLAILSQPPRYGVVTETNLKQSTIDEDVARAFALYYSAKKIAGSKFFQNIKYDLPAIDNKLFYGGVNPFGPKKENLFLKVIDIASLVVSPTGMDVIFDGIGAYYCLATGDNIAAAVYVIGMSMPYVAAGAINLAKEPIKRAVMAGKSWAFKRASGSYELIANDRLWVNYVFRDQSKILSQYGETALSPDAYIKVAGHQEDKAFIKAIDDGVDDANVVKAINDDPELIDEFHVFYNAGKGTLKDFLKQTPISRRIPKPKGTILGEHENYIIYQAETGEQRIRFLASESFTERKARPGRLYTTDCLAAINDEGNVFVLEGRHRAIGAAHGNKIPEELGGVEEDVLDFNYDSRYNGMAGGVRVRDLQIDYSQPDVLLREANIIRAFTEVRNTPNFDPILTKMLDEANADKNEALLADLLGINPNPKGVEIGVSGNKYPDKFPILEAKQIQDINNRNFIKVEAKDLLNHELKIKDGKFYVQGERLTEGELELYLFVMDKDGRIYVKSAGEDPGKFFHSSFLPGKNVASAGTLNIDAGKIVVTNHSGHFEPTVDGILQTVREITARGVDIKKISLDIMAPRIRD
jgi:hypothetical protein